MRDAVMRYAFKRRAAGTKMNFVSRPVVPREVQIRKLLLNQYRNRMLIRGKPSFAAKIGANQLRQLPTLDSIGSDNDCPIWLCRVVQNNRRKAMVRALVFMNFALLLKPLGRHTWLMIPEKLNSLACFFGHTGRTEVHC